MPSGEPSWRAKCLPSARSPGPPSRVRSVQSGRPGTSSGSLGHRASGSKPANPANNSRFAMLLSLFPELRVVVARKLCVRDLVRLSRASKQLNALCVDVGERAVQMIAAGEDAPLPAGLSEHVLHRLARLCGVSFVTAAFADAVSEATDHKTDVTWDLAALEKAYVVLSIASWSLSLHYSRLSASGEWRFKVEPDCSAATIGIVPTPRAEHSTSSNPSSLSANTIATIASPGSTWTAPSTCSTSAATSAQWRALAG